MATHNSSSSLGIQISHHLLQTLSIPPSPSWIASFLSTQKATTPLPSLLATAKVRFLNADITLAVSPSPHTPLLPTPALSTSSSSISAGNPATILPDDILNATLPERRLQGVIVVQVMSVENISKSRWAQIEALEAAERGETTKGREIVRVVPNLQMDDDHDDGGGDGSGLDRGRGRGGGGSGAGGSVGMSKLRVQDARGVNVFAMELRPVNGVRVGMGIGCKILLRNVRVARAVLLLEPDTTTVLGGKVETLHKTWMERRKEELRAGIPNGST